MLMVGWGGIITFMFLYTHRHGNRHCSFIISYCWGGVGWGGIITFMFLYTHRRGNRHCSFIISYCWTTWFEGPCVSFRQ